MPASSSPPKNIKRKTSLFDLVLDNEPISVDALAELAGISCSTLRRELRGLVADGLANLNAGQVTIALADANLALSMTKAIVDRALAAYREIINVR